MATFIRMAALVAATLAGTAFPANAAGWYVSVAGGMTRVEGGLAESHAIDFDSPSTVSDSGERGAWRVGIGLALREPFSIELNYADYGRQTLFVMGSPNPIVFPVEVLSQSRSSERKVTAVGLDLVARLPLRSRWSIVARAGATYATVETTSHTVAPGGFPFGQGPTDFSTTARDRSVVPRLALGVACEPVPQWNVDLTYELLGSAGSDFAAGAQDRTGRARQATAWLALSRRF